MLFENLRSLPILRKQVSTGKISECSHPALSVSFEIDSVSRVMHVECKEFDETLAAEIPLDQLENSPNIEVK